MCELCIFAGTTEGRQLIDFLAGQPVRVLACVATGYGGSLVPEADNIELSAGRLDETDMEVLFTARRFDLVIDATHPFATLASRSIAAACAATDTRYLRLNRGVGAMEDGAVYVSSIQGAADWLAVHPGVALLATGSKELAPYAAVEGYRDRFYPRVLPMASSLAACEAAGFSPSHIIAMQGPFSVEMNVAMLRSIHADYLVTKDSGDSGGFSDKLEAARQAGVRCVVIGRPEQTDGLDYAGTVRLLMERFGLADVRQIDVVGIGMGSLDTLTVEAQKALEAADCFIGATRMLEAVARFQKPAFARIAPSGIVEVIAAHPEYRRIAVVMSGDSGFYSGTKKLLPLLEGHHVRVVPGLSSMQVLCARLGTSWDDALAISLHGREGSIVPSVRTHGKVFALTDGPDALRRVCGDLCAAGMGDARVSVGQRLSYPDEAILSGTARELRDRDCAPLSVMLVERPLESRVLPLGLPDELFVRQLGEAGRTVPMTKSEVRAVSVSKLRLTEDAVVWDVGAGTGSVSVEAALLCPRGYVYAVECREDAAALVEQNAERFGLRNLTVIRGMAPEALKDLPAPSHVFIGGSSGGMERIVDLALAKNPSARFVVNVIALESVAEVSRLIREKGFDDSETVLLNVSRSRAAGSYHLMNALNPIWIASMQRTEGGVPDEG